MACLESRIREFGPLLLKLGNAIKNNFERVTPSEDHGNRFLVRDPVNPKKPEAIEIDLDLLRTLLGDFKEAVAEKEQTEVCMERTGMTRFIR